MTNFNQYMTKEANLASISKASVDLIRSLLPLAIIAPTIAGSGIAIAHSKLTSPSESEKDIMTPQDESLARMYEMEAAKRRRELIEKIDKGLVK